MTNISIKTNSIDTKCLWNFHINSFWFCPKNFARLTRLITKRKADDKIWPKFADFGIFYGARTDSANKKITKTKREPEMSIILKLLPTDLTIAHLRFSKMVTRPIALCKSTKIIIKIALLHSFRTLMMARTYSRTYD